MAATKKRPSKSAPARPRRKSASRPVAPAFQSPALAQQQPSAPERGIPYGPVVLGLAVLVAVGWWCMKRGGTQDQAAPQAPAIPASAAAAPQAALPTPQDVPHVSEEGQHSAEAPTGSSHESSHALVFSPASGKPLSLRCWSENGAPARLDIFNRHNRLVRSVLSAPGLSGWQELAWDGLDSHGAQVPAGRYYARPTQKEDQLVLELKVKN
jgi:hypothetical protein